MMLCLRIASILLVSATVTPLTFHSEQKYRRITPITVPSRVIVSSSSKSDGAYHRAVVINVSRTIVPNGSVILRVLSNLEPNMADRTVESSTGKPYVIPGGRYAHRAKGDNFKSSFNHHGVPQVLPSWLKQTLESPSTSAVPIVRRNGLTEMFSCYSEEDCQLVENSYCYNNCCHCNMRYQWINKALGCLPKRGLGASCQDTMQCIAPNSVCRNGQCECLFSSGQEGNICLPYDTEFKKAKYEIAIIASACLFFTLVVMALCCVLKKSYCPNREQYHTLDETDETDTTWSIGSHPLYPKPPTYEQALEHPVATISGTPPPTYGEAILQAIQSSPSNGTFPTATDTAVNPSLTPSLESGHQDTSRFEFCQTRHQPQSSSSL